MLAKIVPRGAAATVTVLVREKDAAFLRPGTPARLEIDRLPVGEFGTAGAVVTRVASDLASSDEMQELMGPGATPAGPQLRVEVALAEDARTSQLRPYFASGTLVTARFALRQRRILTLLFDPLRRWWN